MRRFITARWRHTYSLLCSLPSHFDRVGLTSSSPSPFCFSPLSPFPSRFAHTFLGRDEVRPYKKCKFQASGGLIDGVGDVERVIDEVVSDKKVAKASHPAMYAWVLPSTSTGGGGRGGPHSYQSGWEDGGESGSGKVLLSLLESVVVRKEEGEGRGENRQKGGGAKAKRGGKAKKSKEEEREEEEEEGKRGRRGVVVVVTRWFGGSHLGSARFREIRACAKAFLDTHYRNKG
mmetsp:Transcript_26724/g.68681  ORF Transcript_26724/g.68681 Transcript_26724/m.68681 type:complete len:232 (-) Transcript_26724:180-875(-)